MASSNDNTAPAQVNAQQDELVAKALVKFAKELQVIENITYKLILPDAQAKATGLLYARARTGIGRREYGVISFEMPPQLAEQQASQYRTSAEEHATAFAEAFNAAINGTAAQNDPKSVPNKNIASAEGTEVHIALDDFRGFLARNAVADQLPQVARNYSVNYGIQHAVKTTPQIVDRIIASGAMQREQQKVYDHAKEAIVSDDPQAYITALQATDEEMAQEVAETVNEAFKYAGAIVTQNNQELLGSIQQQSPGFAEVVELAVSLVQQQMAEAIRDSAVEPAAAGELDALIQAAVIGRDPVAMEALQQQFAAAAAAARAGNPAAMEALEAKMQAVLEQYKANGKKIPGPLSDELLDNLMKENPPPEAMAALNAAVGKAAAEGDKETLDAIQRQLDAAMGLPSEEQLAAQESAVPAADSAATEQSSRLHVAAGQEDVKEALASDGPTERPSGLLVAKPGDVDAVVAAQEAAEAAAAEAAPTKEGSFVQRTRGDVRKVAQGGGRGA